MAGGGAGAAADIEDAFARRDTGMIDKKARPRTEDRRHEKFFERFRSRRIDAFNRCSFGQRSSHDAEPSPDAVRPLLM